MRHQAILEHQFGGVGRAPAVLVERAADTEARRSLLDEEHGDRLATAGQVAGLRGDAIEIGMNAVGDKHLGAVQHIAGIGLARGGADAFHV